MDDETTHLIPEPELLKHIDPALKSQIQVLIGRPENLEIGNEIGRGLLLDCSQKLMVASLFLSET